jgi:hypothetical protein
VKRVARRQLRLARYLQHPGDGRPRPQIPAERLLWAQLIGQVLREWSFHGIEALVRLPARRVLGGRVASACRAKFRNGCPGGSCVDFSTPG